MSEPASIRVYMTPLVETGVYGETVDVTQDVDVSDLIKSGGLGTLKRQLDFGDFDIGVYVFGDITLKCINYDGRFNDSSDWRSMFPYRRDLTKVEIKVISGEGVVYSRFKGLINDDATKQDYAKGEASIRVLSLDSIFRKNNVAGGAISNGNSFKSAIETILNVPEVTSILGYDVANIELGYNGTIDDASVFDQAIIKGALDDLLLASNAILYIDGSDNIIVTPRKERDTTHYFYGNDHIEGRDNIINISNYNNGTQRGFNTIKVNETVRTNDGWAEEYGVREKSFDLGFITNETTEEEIGDALLAEFAVPKPELEIEVSSFDAVQVDLLHKVRVDFDYMKRPPPGQDLLTLTGTATTGSAVTNTATGNIRIRPEQIFKVVGIEERPRQMITKLKLRQVGNLTSEGWA